MRKPQSLLEFSYEAIKKQILRGELEPGKKLNVKTLSEQLEVSQTPIKEACNRLVAEGFVQSIPMHGYFVNKLTVKDFLDMVEVRKMMETFAISGSIKNRHKFPDILERLEELLELYEDPEALDYSSAAELEYEFHSLLIKLADNRRLEKLYTTDWSVGLIYFFYSAIGYPIEKLKPLFSTHRPLYEALLEGDANKMEHYLIGALDDVVDIVVPLVEKIDNNVFVD